MQAKFLLIVTALGEAGIGLCLLAAPAVTMDWLLGVTRAAAESLLVARVAGAALLAIGVASWVARTDGGSEAQRGLLLGILIYDVGAAVLLILAGTVMELAGVALWPAAGLHMALAVYCVQVIVVCTNKR